MDKTKSSRKMQADATKRRIFDCALKLLLEQGYEKITVRDIVDAAGVSIGSFYNYYSSKLDVYYETYSIADAYFETVVAAEMTGRSFEEKFFLFFEHYAKYACEVTGLALSKLLYSSDNRSFDRGDDAGMHSLLINVIQEGLDQGSLRSGSTASELAQFFLIAVRGLTYNWCTHDGDYDLVKATDDYLRVLYRSFK